MNWQEWLYTLPLRMCSLLRRAQVEQKLREELQFQADQRNRQEIVAGKTAPPKRVMPLCVRWTVWSTSSEQRPAPWCPVHWSRRA